MPYITSIERLSRQEGRREGLQEGHREGHQEGQATMLISLLELKFGPLGEAERTCIQSADADTLLRRSTRLLNAQALDEVLGTGTERPLDH